MAAPHVAGALALLLSAVPSLSADRQAAALESSALDLGEAGPDNDFGYGRLDALAALYWAASTPDFTLTVSPSPATTVAGGVASYTLTVGSVGGFSPSVSLSLSGLPAEQGSWALSPSTIPGAAGTSTLTITTATSLAAGIYGLTLTATSGDVSHTVPVTLVLTPPPAFTASASLNSASAIPAAVSHRQ
jgi:hypothetical protein